MIKLISSFNNNTEVGLAGGGQGQQKLWMQGRMEGEESYNNTRSACLAAQNPDSQNATSVTCPEYGNITAAAWIDASCSVTAVI
jgi:hypothetical protein